MDYEFGKKLKDYRLQSGMTQQQLANQMNVSKSVVSYYELNARVPSPEVLRKIAAIFHVSADHLLGIERERVVDISGLDADDERVVRQMIELLRMKNSR